MNYKSIVKYILDNFVFTTLNTEFKYPYEETEFGNKIPNNVISGESQRFYDFFDHTFFKVGNDYFHNKEIINFLKEYKRPQKLEYDLAMMSNKKVILEMSFHPCSDSLTPHQTIKTHLFDKLLQDKILINKLKNGSLFILLYQGWEPQNFTEKTREQDTIENYYEILQLVFNEYGIPNNSIIPMGSNARGYEYESKYDFKYKKVHSIFDNFMEVESFLAIPDELTLDLNYSFDEHISNIKKSNRSILRISRTYNKFRNHMLYFLYKNNLQNKSILEHKEFDTSQTIDVFGNVDNRVVETIENNLPLVASQYEKNKQVNNYSNQVIPYDVYKNTIFTWCSSSLPEQIDKVYLSQSTFNPILFYHPIVWHAQPYHIKCFKNSGYKTYDWLFNESIDNIDEHEWKNNYVKLRSNFKDVQSVMNMDRNKLIDKLIENKDTLEYNRNLLIKCNSVERIIRKFYETTI